MQPSGATPSTSTPASDDALLVTRVRSGLWLVIASTVGIAVSEVVLRPGKLPSADALQGYTLAVLVAAQAILVVRPTGSTATLIGLVAVGAASHAIARVAILTPYIPEHAYIALGIATAAVIPWSVSAQAVAVLLIGAAYGWNAATVIQWRPFLTSRELSSMAVIAVAILYVSWLLARQRQMQRNEVELLRDRERALADERARLEERVAERTEALSRANATLSAEVGERRRVQQQMELLTDSVPAFIGFVDAGGHYVWVNQRYEDWWQQPRAAIVGRHLREMHSPQVWLQIEPHFTQAVNGRRSTFEVAVTARDGTPRRFEVQFIPHRPGSESVQGLFILGFDVTLRRANEETQRRTDRLAALGTLAAGIAHEINNPAASILATAEMLQALIPDVPGDVLDGAVRGIAGEAERCGTIVRTVLRFAREEPRERSLHPALGVAERAVELLRGELALAGATVHLDVSPTLPLVLMSPTEILQVLLNLLTNALRAGATEITLRGEARTGVVALAVHDNGRGMTDAERARIFDPFFTTSRQHGGTGLGLSVCHAIVTEHRGTIDVRSTVGRGTIVTVRLPTTAADVDDAPLARTGT